MAVSTMDLAGLRSAALRQLVDAGLAVFSNDMIDQGARLAIAEMGAARPRHLWQVSQPAVTVTTRHIDADFLAAYRGAKVTRVVADLDGAIPAGLDSGREVGFRVIGEDPTGIGVPFLELDEYVNWDAVTARVVIFFDHPVWELKDLDGATATTFFAHWEHWLVMGACAHAAMMRAIDLAEDVAAGIVNSVGGGAGFGEERRAPSRSRVGGLGGTQTYASMSGKVGNYGAIATIWLKQFREWMTEAPEPRGKRFATRRRAGQPYYDANLLQWR